MSSFFRRREHDFCVFTLTGWHHFYILYRKKTMQSTGITCPERKVLQMAKLKKGDQAPAFSLPDQSGKTVKLNSRSSFLIDEKGRIMGAWYKVSPDDTVPKALEALGIS